MRLVFGIALCVLLCSSHLVRAESLRCHGDIIEVGDAKVDVLRKCGEPVLKDTYCEKTPIRIKRIDGIWDTVERCENVDVWTYNPGKGQFWTNLYFTEGKLREMRYGERVE
jgi:hypothetical protein